MRFVERFDANSYVTLSLAMDLFDLGATPEKLATALSNARSRWLVLSFSSDWLFPPEQSRDIVDALVANAGRVSYCNVQSTCGHDAFLLADDFATYGEMTRAFLNNLAAAPREFRTAAAASGSDPLRPERRLAYDRMIELIPPHASVLDLGCGTGRLLARLKQNGSRRLVGIELDETKIVGAVRRDLDVIHADLNHGLRAFSDQEFDCVVLSQTLQAVQNVQGVISDMLRVGRTCIVSFPNLAYHKLRRILADDGRAPRSYGWLRDKWYDTHDIRFLSIADFEDFCKEKNVQIDRRIALDTEAGVEVADNPNLNADLAIFVIRRGV
jgi:homoserine O-acetyltransferase